MELKYNFTPWFGISALLLLLGVFGGPSSSSLRLVEGLECPTCIRIGSNGSDSCDEMVRCNSHADYIVAEREMIEDKDDIIQKMKIARRAEIGNSEGEISLTSTMKRQIAALEGLEVEGMIVCTKRVGSAWVVTLKKPKLLPYVEAKCDLVKTRVDDTCLSEEPKHRDMEEGNIDQVHFLADKGYCTCDESTVSQCQVSDEELMRAGAKLVHGVVWCWRQLIVIINLLFLYMLANQNLF